MKRFLFILLLLPIFIFSQTINTIGVGDTPIENLSIYGQTSITNISKIGETDLPSGSSFSNVIYVSLDGDDSFFVNDTTNGRSEQTKECTDEFTMMYWFRMSNYSFNTATIYNRGSGNYFKYIGDSIMFMNMVGAPLYWKLDNPAHLSNDTWYHFALTRDADDTLRMWVNGVEQDSVNYNTSSFLFDEIGQGASGVNETYDLDEFAVWDTDESANISTVYGDVPGNPVFAGDPREVSDCIWYYPMGDLSFIDSTMYNEGSSSVYGDTLIYLNGLSTDFKEHPVNEHYLHFNGQSDAPFNLGTESDYDIGSTESFSIGFWFRIGNDEYTHSYLMSKGFFTEFYSATISQVQTKFGIGDGTTSTTAVNYSDYIDSTWHHYAGVWDNAVDSVNLYIDGVRVNRAEQATFTGIDNSSTFRVAGFGGNYLTGALDEFFFTRTALTREDVLEIIGNGLTDITDVGNPLDVLSSTDTYLDMEEGTGTTLDDSGDLANDATIDATDTSWGSH